MTLALFFSLPRDYNVAQPMATLPFNNAKNQLSSKQSFTQKIFLKEASMFQDCFSLTLSMVAATKWSFHRAVNVSNKG